MPNGGYSIQRGPLTNPVVTGPAQTPGHHLSDLFSYGSHGGAVTSHPDLGSHVEAVVQGQHAVETIIHQFLDSHPNIAAHIEADLSGPHGLHQLPFVGHVDWAI